DLGRFRKFSGRTAPAQFVDVVENGCIGAECCERDEQRRKLAIILQHVGREGGDRSVAVEQSCSGGGTDAADSREAVRAVADECEIVGNERWWHAELLAHALLVADLVAAPIDLHHARAAYALSEVLVGRPDAD